jgi:hypothetical protein
LEVNGKVLELRRFGLLSKCKRWEVELALFFVADPKAAREEVLMFYDTIKAVRLDQSD